MLVLNNIIKKLMETKRKRVRNQVIESRCTDTNFASAYLKGQKIKRTFREIAKQGKGGEMCVVVGSKSISLDKLEFQIDCLTREHTELAYNTLMDKGLEKGFTSLFNKNSMHGK